MCPYWLGADAADKSMEDHDVHVCSFSGASTGSLVEVLKILWLAPNDDWVHGTYDPKVPQFPFTFNFIFHFILVNLNLTFGKLNIYF